MAAMYDHFTKDEIGIQKSSLYTMGLPKQTYKCHISKQPLYSQKKHDTSND